MAGCLDVEVLCGTEVGFNATATLIAGRRDAVLVDTLFLRTEAEDIVRRIKARRLNLTHVVVTHGHCDHYFGATVLTTAFPGVRVVALPATVVAVSRTVDKKRAQWRSLLGDEIPTAALLPEPLLDATIELEQTDIQVRGPRQGDSGDNALVWIPDHRVVVAGDIVFNRAFVSIAGTSTSDRLRWIDALDEIARLRPSKLIAGHKEPAAPDSVDALDYTRAYLETVNELLAQEVTASEFERAIRERFGHVGTLEYALREAGREFCRSAAAPPACRRLEDQSTGAEGVTGGS